MKGVLLAGGSGTRLYPLTQAVCKQLLPVYDKPVVYYPLSLLMLAGIRDILLISTPHDLPLIRRLLGDGRQLGLSLAYAEQPRPAGIAEAFLIAADWLAGSPVCLILGDNLFHGHQLAELLQETARRFEGPGGGGQAQIFACRVQEPQRYGVVEFDAAGRVLSIEEKPARPRSTWAVPGLYFYDAQVVAVARGLKPSARGELEITDVNRTYLERGQLTVTPVGRGVAWLDMGTHDTLLSASLFVQTIEHRTGLKIACLEEIALTRRLIDLAQFHRLAGPYGDSPYGRYLQQVAQEHLSTTR